MKKLLTLSALLFGLSVFTGCETVKETLYEAVPYDEVAAERGITLEEAEALGLVRPKTSLEPLIEATTSLIPAPGVAPLTSLALNGLLAIGAVWLGKKKRTADKVSASLVQGIDTFRTFSIKHRKAKRSTLSTRPPSAITSKPSKCSAKSPSSSTATPRPPKHRLN